MTTRDDTRTTQVFDIRFDGSMARRLFLSSERSRNQVKSVGFWKLVGDLARESTSFILGKERPHAPVDI